MNQVERNPALHSLLKLCGFWFNYSNLTRNSNPQTNFPSSKSWFPTSTWTRSFSHTQSCPWKPKSCFWNQRSTSQRGHSFTAGRGCEGVWSIYYLQTSNKNTFQATVQTVKRPSYMIFICSLPTHRLPGRWNARKPPLVCSGGESLGLPAFYQATWSTSTRTCQHAAQQAA